MEITDEKTRDFEILKETEGIRLSAKVIHAGSDLVMVVTGGVKPHVGSVSLGFESHEGYHTSLLKISGHRDDLISEMFAQAISKNMKCACAVICGIHIDNITPDQIKKIVSMSKEMIELVTDKLK